MLIVKDKVKAFLSNEKKVEAIAGDQKFLDAVSGGTATTKTIVEEFGKAGLTLNDGEAANIRDTAKKLIDTPLEKLSEVDTKNVSGGDHLECLLRGLGETGEAVGAISGLGCWIAGTVCKSQAAKALNAGNTEKSKKLTKAANGLHIATGACLGTSVLGLGVAKGVDIWARHTDE